MTLTAETESDASQEAVAERVRKIRERQDVGVSRAEGWRRRGPLLPALIFMIAVTQVPFLFTLYYSTLSWNLVRPGSRQFVGIPEFQDLGTRVSQQISAAIAGQKSVDAAMEQAQLYAEVVGKSYQEKR